MRHQLHKSRVDQNARTNTIKHPVHHQRRLRAGSIRIPHPQPHRNRHRRANPIQQRQRIRRPQPMPRPRRHRQPTPQPQPLKGLMKDQHDVQRVELLSRHRQREPDEDGVEDDAEFEDEDGGEVRDVVLPRTGKVADDEEIAVAAGVGEVVVAGDVAAGGGGRMMMMAGFVAGGALARLERVVAADRAGR